LLERSEATYLLGHAITGGGKLVAHNAFSQVGLRLVYRVVSSRA
jgi:hypothetical protein